MAMPTPTNPLGQPDRPAGASDFEFRDKDGNIRRFGDLSQQERDQMGAAATKNIQGQGFFDGAKAAEAHQKMDVERNAEAAGVGIGGTQTSAGGIGGFFGERAGMNIYVPQALSNTSYDPNQARINSAIAALGQRPIGAQAATVGPAAQIAAGPQDQVRAQQLGLIGQLGAAAAGNGPSAAQAQLKMAADRNMANAMAMAAAQGTPAAARQAAFQRAAITQDAAGQSAMLRAQEQQAAMGMLGQFTQSTRQQDLGLAGEQAQLNQQAQLAQAGFQQQANMATLDEQARRDALMQSYLSMGMSLDQAAQQAEIQQRQFTAGLLAQQEAAAKGISIQNAAQGIQVAGAVAGAVASGGASLAGSLASQAAQKKG